jgi:hypothetical protein
MPRSLVDGTVLYEYPDEFVDIRVNGQSYASHNPYSAMVQPDGYGNVLLIAMPDIITSDGGRVVKQGTFLKETWIDGQYKSYYISGVVEITLGSSEPAPAVAGGTDPAVTIA